MNKRIVIYLIALSCVLPVAVFGAPQQESSGAEETMTITLMSEFQEPTWAMQKIGEDLSIEIIPNGVSPNDSEKVDVLLASGEFPDCGPVFEDPQTMYNQGITRPIPKSMIRENAPGYTKIMESYPVGWLANQNPDNDEELLCVNGIATNTDIGSFLPMFRLDWAQNVGFEFPDYENTKYSIDRFERTYYYDADYTLEWFKELLIAFRDGDPDGNGKNDTIPLQANQSLHRNFRSPAGAYGIVWGGNREVDGELYDYRIDPAMKDFLIEMADWYSKELIDREFVNLGLRKGWEKIATGMIGATFEESTYAGRSWGMDRPPNSFVPDEELGTPGAEVVVLPPLVGPDGIQGTRAYRDVVPSGGYRWFVGAGASDEKLEKILQFVDTKTTPEGWAYWFAGKPGVHFDWEGDPWESNPIQREPTNVPEEYPENGKISGYPPIRPPERLKMLLPGRLAAFFNDLLLAERGQNWALRRTRLDYMGETDLQKIDERYGADLNTMFEEYFFQAVLGEIDVEATWNDYVSDWLAAGGEKRIEELKKAPLVSELRKGKLVY